MNEPLECRICCGESEPDNVLLTPCQCSGSMQYIHEKCLYLWISVIPESDTLDTTLEELDSSESSESSNNSLDTNNSLNNNNNNTLDTLDLNNTYPQEIYENIHHIKYKKTFQRKIIIHNNEHDQNIYFCELCKYPYNIILLYYVPWLTHWKYFLNEWNAWSIKKKCLNKCLCCKKKENNEENENLRSMEDTYKKPLHYITEKNSLYYIFYISIFFITCIVFHILFISIYNNIDHNPFEFDDKHIGFLHEYGLWLYSLICIIYLFTSIGMMYALYVLIYRWLRHISCVEIVQINHHDSFHI